MRGSCQRWAAWRRSIRQSSLSGITAAQLGIRLAMRLVALPSCGLSEALEQTVRLTPDIVTGATGGIAWDVLPHPVSNHSIEELLCAAERG